MRPGGSGARRVFLTIVAGLCLWAGCGDSPTAPGKVDPEALLREELSRTDLTLSWYRGCIWQNFRQHLPSYQGQTVQFILADIRAIIASCLAAEGPSDGALEVTTSTTGEDLDADGYSLTVDGGTPEAIGNDAVVTKSNLAPGDHQVELSGVASNCTVAGDNPRTVAVASGATAQTTFAVTCSALPPTEGALRVITTTSGSDLDADGYTVSIGGPGNAIGVEDSLDFPGLTPGDYQVELTGVAVNCSVADDNPRTVAVTAGATAQTTFAVTCSAVAVPGQIVFARDGDGIWIIDADGSNAAQLTTVASDDTPDVSPNGGALVFSSGAGPINLFTSDIDGSNRVQLTNSTGASVFNYDPEFSPDGSKIVFYSNRTGTSHIWVMNSDGSNAVQLTSSGQNGYPSWSPDGTKILFATDRDGNFEIYVMDADGSDQTRLTNNSSVEFRSAFSPDGTKIAFDTNRNAGAFDIYVMDADGTNQIPMTTDAGLDVRPAWSPDGQSIAFTSDRDGTADIWVMDAGGSNQTDVSQTGSDTYATWMP